MSGRSNRKHFGLNLFLEEGTMTILAAGGRAGLISRGLDRTPLAARRHLVAIAFRGGSLFPNQRAPRPRRLPPSLRCPTAAKTTEGGPIVVQVAVVRRVAELLALMHQRAP